MGSGHLRHRARRYRAHRSHSRQGQQGGFTVQLGTCARKQRRQPAPDIHGPGSTRRALRQIRAYDRLLHTRHRRQRRRFPHHPRHAQAPLHSQPCRRLHLRPHHLASGTEQALHLQRHGAVLASRRTGLGHSLHIQLFPQHDAPPRRPHAGDRSLPQRRFRRHAGYQF